MSAAPNIPWELPSTVAVNSDGELTPPPSPVLFANGGPTNGAGPAVNTTDDDVSNDSETLVSSGTGSELTVDVQPMAGAMIPPLADDESIGDESSGSDSSVGGSSYHEHQSPDLIVHTAAGDIHVHRHILSRDETFSRLLMDSPATLDMRDETPTAVESLLRYIYNPSTPITLTNTPITHLSAVSRLAERFAMWDLANRAEEALPLAIREHTLREFIAGFRDAFLAEEASESNRNIQRSFLDEACVRMSALIANAEFRDFLDSQPTPAVGILQRLFLGPPRPLPQYVPQECANCGNAWWAASFSVMQYCPYCGWGLGG